MRVKQGCNREGAGRATGGGGGQGGIGVESSRLGGGGVKMKGLTPVRLSATNRAACHQQELLFYSFPRRLFLGRRPLLLLPLRRCYQPTNCQTCQRTNERRTEPRYSHILISTTCVGWHTCSPVGVTDFSPLQPVSARNDLILVRETRYSAGATRVPCIYKYLCIKDLLLQKF